MDNKTQKIEQSQKIYNDLLGKISELVTEAEAELQQLQKEKGVVK